MKMTKIAVAAVALCTGAAFAQDAKVYATFDASLATANNQGATGASVTRMVSAGDAPSVFGVTGSKKLANGMTASGQYEAGINLSNGTVGASANTVGATNSANPALFNRLANVGLAGNFGKVSLGLQLDPAFIAMLVTDPTGAKDISGGISAWLAGGIATAGGLAATNTTGNQGNPAAAFTTNAVQYANQFGPVAVTASYGVGTTGNSDTTTAVGVIYGAGPLTVSGGVSNNSKSATTGLDSSSTVIGAAYQLGAWRLAANYQTAKNNNLELKTTGFGAIYGLSQATSLHAAMFQTQPSQSGVGNLNVMNLGVAHDLDKSVRLYAYLNTTQADANSLLVAGGWGSENAIGAFGAAAGKTVQTMYLGTRVSF